MLSLEHTTMSHRKLNSTGKLSMKEENNGSIVVIIVLYEFNGMHSLYIPKSKGYSSQ